MLKIFHKRTQQIDLLKGGHYILIGSTIVNICNFFFQVIIGRVLGPADYSTLAATVSIIVILTFPGASIETAVSRRVAELASENNKMAIPAFIRALILKLILIALLFIIVILFFGVELLKSLNLPSTIVFIFIAQIFFSAISPVIRGTLLGIRRELFYSIVLVFSSIMKLVLGIIFVSLSLGVDIVASAFLAGPILAHMIAFFYLRELFFRQQDEASSIEVNYKDLFTEILPILLISFGLLLFTQIDLVLTKAFFSANDAGYYAAASNIGKIIVYLPGSLVVIIVPRTTGYRTREMQTLRVLFEGLLVTGVLSFFIFLGFFFWPDIPVLIIYGESFAGATSLVRYFSLIMVVFSLLRVVVSYNLAMRRYIVLFPVFLFPFCELILIILLHTSLWIVQTILLGCVLGGFVVSLLFTLYYDFISSTNSISYDRVSSP